MLKEKAASRFEKRVCYLCGEEWIGISSSCPKPNCGGFGKSEGEFTKKIVDDNDLKKGF